MKANAHQQGRLHTQIAAPNVPITPGLHPLGFREERDGLLYVPATHRPAQPAPLALLLHGAGGNAHDGIRLLQGRADDAGVLLLAVDSRRSTWDIITSRHYGPDVAFIDRALAFTFARCNVDPVHLAVGGFSDGASYALSLGLANGDLFTHILAYSPGFMAPARQEGEPRIFISHGIHDAVLPIERCSRRIAPALERAGYDLLYRELDGPHTIPHDVLQQSLTWWLA